MDIFNTLASDKVVLQLVGVVALLFSLLSRNAKGTRPILALLGIASIAIGMGSAYVDDLMLWGWVMAILPAALVAHHAIYLVWMKPRFVPDDLDGLRPVATGHARMIEEAASASRRYFAPSHIVMRLGVPALVLLLSGLTVISVIHPDAPLLKKSPLSFTGREQLLEAIRFGAAGAYVYVLTVLGQRSFRHDVSSGAALWCAVTLILGPILAGVVSFVWKPDTATANWAQQLAYFFAGVSPRSVVQVLQDTARRMLEGQSQVVQPPLRSLPLGYIGGITPEVAERLREEGISDVYALSMADPHRLLRNTPFNKKEILDWIDQAVLIRSLPDHWEKLMKAGVGGAMDLAWYVKK